MVELLDWYDRLDGNHLSILGVDSKDNYRRHLEKIGTDTVATRLMIFVPFKTRVKVPKYGELFLGVVHSPYIEDVKYRIVRGKKKRVIQAVNYGGWWRITAQPFPLCKFSDQLELEIVGKNLLSVELAWLLIHSTEDKQTLMDTQLAPELLIAPGKQLTGVFS